ncbi:MAG: hypothetical protein WDZ68_01310 [Candidatus Paceibacterota bacterium]
MEQIALTVHITTVFALIAVVLYTDKIGLPRTRGGKKEMLSLRTFSILHRLAWFGLIVMIRSGFVMFLSYKSYLLINSGFLCKNLFCTDAYNKCIFYRPADACC